MIIFVAAHGKNREMGFKGGLPWPLMKADRAHLHSIANGKTVVMGEKTVHNYASVTASYATDHVVVLSRTISSSAPGVEVVGDIQPIIERAKTEDLYVVGGASIFTQLLPYAQRMYLTEIDGEFDADTYFPEYNQSDWHVTSEDPHQLDEQNPYPYTFVTRQRTNKVPALKGHSN